MIGEWAAALHETLSREFMARFPKIRAALACGAAIKDPPKLTSLQAAVGGNIETIVQFNFYGFVSAVWRHVREMALTLPIVSANGTAS
jgi:hypothetical protein